MSSAAKQFFNSIQNYSDLQELIAEGETEGLYLECKSPGSPNLNKDLRVTLAKAISGFANASGGVLAWGISTTKHQHGSLDVLSQLEPIANCKNFMRQINVFSFYKPLIGLLIATFKNALCRYFAC